MCGGGDGENIMNQTIEEKFTKAFIVKDKRKRILYELSSAKKRSAAIWRIYDLLDKNFVVFQSQKYDEKKLLAEIKKYTKSDDCYIIAGSELDGKTLSLEEAVYKVLYGGAVCVLICDEKTVVAAEEYEYGAPNKAILHKN